MSLIMKPVLDARISLLIYQYSPIETTITDAVLRQFILSYHSFTGRKLTVTATTQSPFAAYFDEVEVNPSDPDERVHTKRDFVVMLEEALASARQPAQAPEIPLTMGVDLIKAMSLAAERARSDIQVNYKSSEERRSVLLTKLDAEALNSASASI